MTTLVSNDKVEKIWFTDLKGFFDSDKLTKFIPDKSMTFEEQLNCAFRFSLYFSLVVFIVRQDLRVLYFGVFVGFMTIIMYNVEHESKQTRNKVLEKLDLSQPSMATKKMCVKPTKNNPYMNVMLGDIENFPNRPKACNLNNSSIKALADKHANGDLYKEIDDVYHKKSSDRQFFTNPVTTLANSQSEFAHWLYNTGKTCKEDTVKCTRRLW